MDHNKMPLCDALKDYVLSGRTSMHVPGHKGKKASIPELSWIMGDQTLKCDITEIAGFDDYHEPEGIIKEAQELAADLYGSDQCFFLVNGTTSGLMAAVAAAAGQDERIVIARDCHKSVARGLVISGASPIYLDPYIDEDTVLPCGISPSQLEEVLSFTSVKALVLTNPSYYGTYSDLRAIVEVAHSHGAAVIVDEAHGGHLIFADQAGIPDAMSAGADISVQSTHKMNGSLTQTSMLHVKGPLIDRKKLAYHIRLLTSTSPSYLLMASLDAVRHRMAMDGKRIWHEQIEQIRTASGKINSIPGITCVDQFEQAGTGRHHLDGARILISAEELGLRGSQLSDVLYRNHGIDCELSDEKYVLAVAGTGTSAEDLEKLEAALRLISDERYGRDDKIRGRETLSAAGHAAGMKHEYELTPREAVMAGHEEVELAYASGRISARDIAVYPPGIPLLVAGEKISGEMIALIYGLAEKGVHIHGIDQVEKDGDSRIMLTVTEDEARAMLFDCIF